MKKFNMDDKINIIILLLLLNLIHIGWELHNMNRIMNEHKDMKAHLAAMK